MDVLLRVEERHRRQDGYLAEPVLVASQSLHFALSIVVVFFFFRVAVVAQLALATGRVALFGAGRASAAQGDGGGRAFGKVNRFEVELVSDDFIEDVRLHGSGLFEEVGGDGRVLHHADLLFAGVDLDVPGGAPDQILEGVGGLRLLGVFGGGLGYGLGRGFLVLRGEVIFRGELLHDVLVVAAVGARVLKYVF